MSDDNHLRGPSVRGIPEGDNREHMICAECGYILYDNPKIVVGSVARWNDRILLVRRSIHPRYGYWTLPAGYLELNESASAGAEREAWEEARARIEIEGLLAIYDIPRISQVQLIYRARLLDEDVQRGPGVPRSRPFRVARHPVDPTRLSLGGLGPPTRSRGARHPRLHCPYQSAGVARERQVRKFRRGCGQKPAPRTGADRRRFRRLRSRGSGSRISRPVTRERRRAPCRRAWS